ncbi:MAG: hypothetical protein HYT10_02160 [Candidatus Levybacteria bacterium]|nr:hypothetical protein [Candidatus Levybacteria bacterium]
MFIQSETQYVLSAFCNNRTTEVVIKTKQLPSGLKFQQTNLTFYFPVITGGVEVSGGSSIVVYSDTNGPKGTIAVSTSGDISVTLQ